MAWNDIEEISEAVQNLILNAHALGPVLSYKAVASPRHDLHIKESWRVKFDNESRRELLRNPGDEIISP